MSVCYFVFFFKQKTAYEMRISDWSSDVCSSDLIGSVAKEFTAATVLRLVDDHRLALDDAVASHLPGFPYPDITVSQLLAHSSGIPEVLDHYGAQLQAGHLSAPLTTRDAVSVLAGERKPLLFAPGTRDRKGTR